MLHRLTNLSKTNSFFLFGPRGTGKSTLVKEHLKNEQYIHIDLLRAAERLELAENPDSLEYRILPEHSWVFIDEIQKVPGLLDTVHRLIEDKKIKFALTGSSARKLKAGAANLLAGRAFVYHLSPLTSFELGDKFNLSHALLWGTLPKLLELASPNDNRDFLEAYALTYLQEEIWEEHLVRNLLPFRAFLRVAAQSNGKVINYSKIAADVGVDTKTVQQYFQILEDTLLAFFLEPYATSTRKKQRTNPKFYLFDVGVWRALTTNYMLEIGESSLGFGNVFEHFLICEMVALNKALKSDLRFSFFRQDNDLEIDLVIERPNKPLALVEIKSLSQIEESTVERLTKAGELFPDAELFCFSRDAVKRRFGRVLALPWKEGIGKFVR